MDPPRTPPTAAASRAADERGSSSGMRSLRPGAPDQSFFLGRYRVVDEIGRGGMASVHLARVDGPGGFHKWVAIKRVHPHLTENDHLVDMFLDEARMAAGINHPNVAQVFDIGKDQGTYWIAMEYLHGEPVRELARAAEERGAPIAAPIAARIIADAAEGLHAAHELRDKNGELMNLVHRDVTPHNLFVTYDGFTKVVDFGIAKAAGRLAETHAGELKGKMAYMAPEQIRSQDLDRRVDVFALGIVLWELTTNQRLFRMDNDLDTLEKVQACVVPRPTSIVRGYPKALEDVVMTALAKDRGDRYQTARAFSRALQSFLRHHALVGFEEVGELMKATFAARLARRNEHLAWAGEVTGTVPPEVALNGRPSAPPEAREPIFSESSIPTLEAETTDDSLEMRAVGRGGLMEDDEEAATLVSKNPTKLVNEILAARAATAAAVAAAASPRPGIAPTAAMALPPGVAIPPAAGRPPPAAFSPGAPGYSTTPAPGFSVTPAPGSASAPRERMRSDATQLLNVGGTAPHVAIPRAPPLPTRPMLTVDDPSTDGSLRIVGGPGELPRVLAADPSTDGGHTSTPIPASFNPNGYHPQAPGAGGPPFPTHQMQGPPGITPPTLQSAVPVPPHAMQPVGPGSLPRASKLPTIVAALAFVTLAAIAALIVTLLRGR